MIGKLYYIFEFIVYYLFQLVSSNVNLAYITLTPKLNIKSGFIEIPLTLKSDFGILLFSNLVSMTPGSLVTDIPANKKSISIHVLYSINDNEIKTEVQRMQNKIKRFTS